MTEEQKEQKWNLDKARVAWYILIFVIFLFLVITNYRLTHIQNENQKVDRLVNYHYNLITDMVNAHNKSVDYQQQFESDVWDNIQILQQLNLDWWLKNHVIPESSLSEQMKSIASNCSLKEPSRNFILSWTDEEISLRFNSSKGEIIVNYFSDGTIKCKKDFWDKYNLSCQELCSNGTNIKI